MNPDRPRCEAPAPKTEVEALVTDDQRRVSNEEPELDELLEELRRVERPGT